MLRCSALQNPHQTARTLDRSATRLARWRPCHRPDETNCGAQNPRLKPAGLACIPRPPRAVLCFSDPALAHFPERVRADCPSLRWTHTHPRSCPKWTQPSRRRSWRLTAAQLAHSAGDDPDVAGAVRARTADPGGLQGAGAYPLRDPIAEGAHGKNTAACIEPELCTRSAPRAMTPPGWWLPVSD